MSDPKPFSEDQINDALALDPLLQAEEITGKSYKESGGTLGLGALLAMHHNGRKRAMLEANSDTYYGMHPDQFAKVATNLGFRVVLSGEFSGRECADQWFIAWSDEGALLWWESYGADSISTAQVRYNWRPHPVEGNEYPQRTPDGFSGHYHADGMWIGYHDVREGLRHLMEQMRTQGAFVRPWVEQPHMWLCEYAIKDPDRRPSDFSVYENATVDKISRLPQEIRDAIKATA